MKFTVFLKAEVFTICILLSHFIYQDVSYFVSSTLKWAMILRQVLIRKCRISWEIFSICHWNWSRISVHNYVKISQLTNLTYCLKPISTTLFFVMILTCLSQVMLLFDLIIHLTANNCMYYITVLVYEILSL